MNSRLVVSQAAEKDILYGYRWYEGVSEGLGTKFLDELEQTFTRVLENPALYVEVIPGLRRSVTKTFPYLIFYVPEANAVHILAVIHAAQNPSYIADRLGELNV